MKRLWTADEDAALRSCYAAGNALEDIGGALGRSGAACAGRAFRLGCKHPAPSGTGRCRVYVSTARPVRSRIQDFSL